MTNQVDYSRDFTAFFADMVAVEGSFGPRPLVPPFLGDWLKIAFPSPDGNPKARNIGDFRTKKEGKSALAGGVALYMASRKAYSEVVITASDIDQAKDRVLRAAKFAVEYGPLNNHAKIFKDTIELDNHSIIQAMPNAVSIANLYLALAKSVTFGVAIALIACHWGLQVEPNTQSLGRGTTSSVVISITAGIVLDAIFAIAFRNVGF